MAIINYGTDMMYTDQMKMAFHSISAPKGFYVDVIDNDHFITLKINEKNFMSLGHFEKLAALEYVIKVKNALEQNGAIVMVVRNSVKK